MLLSNLTNDDNDTNDTKVDRGLIKKLIGAVLTVIRNDPDTKFDFKKKLTQLVKGDALGKGQRGDDIRTWGNLLLQNSELSEQFFSVFNDRCKVLANDATQAFAGFVKALPDSKVSENLESLERLMASSEANGVFMTMLFGISDSVYESPATGVVAEIQKQYRDMEKEMVKVRKEIARQKKEAEKVTSMTAKMRDSIGKMTSGFFSKT